MSLTIEDSNGSRVMFLNQHLANKENSRGYTIQEEKYNKREVKEEDILNIQEFKTYDFEVEIEDDGTIKQTKGNTIKNLDNVIEQIIKNRKARVTEKALQLKRMQEQDNEK